MFVRILLIRVAIDDVQLLFEHALDGAAKQRHVVSQPLKLARFRISATGMYELRSLIAVEPASPGAEAHLLVDRVHLVDNHRAETLGLASFSCVGRVKP